METIGQIMERQSKEVVKQQHSLPALSKGTELKVRFGEDELSFITNNNPDMQSVVAKNVELCYYGGYPTLVELSQAYGEYTPDAWLTAHLFNLSEFCGCKEKLTVDQIAQTARIITVEYYYLNIAELMLFFFRFKLGRYGKFYGSVDPIVITSALRDFIRERNGEIDYYESQHKAELDKINKEKIHAVTREEYEKMKQNNVKFDIPKLVTMEDYLNTKFKEQWKEKKII